MADAGAGEMPIGALTDGLSRRVLPWLLAPGAKRSDWLATSIVRATSAESYVRIPKAGPQLHESTSRPTRNWAIDHPFAYHSMCVSDESYFCRSLSEMINL